ncbi:MAG TPA: GNAT family N-acetyltransferase [Acidimicrobiales bacterium]
MEIRAEPATSALATRLLASFVEEVANRLPEGFDPARSVPASPEDLTPPAGEFLVVFDADGEGIGCGGLKNLGSSAYEVKRMWIAPTHRGRGYARALLGALEERARDLGALELRLDTSAVLAEAVALYRASGFVEVAPYNDNPYASFWFAKRLAAEP